MDYLSVKELAELKGCSERNIRDQIRKGKIYSEQVINDKNRHNCYAIPITALPEELQLKYYQRKRAENGVMPEPAAPKKQKAKRLLTFENCTAEQRKSINLWTAILQDWQGQREQYQKKTEFDHLYVAKCQLEHPELQISTDILYRKWAAYKENDFAGLLGLRGAWNRGSSTIPKPVWEAFLWYYLEENKPPLSRCYQSTLHWTELFYPELLGEIPSERSFRRHVENDVAKAVKELTRNGNKAFADRCMPYIMRMYDDLKPNDVWIADNHTLDIQTVDSSGERHRLYLTAFQDAKSGVIVGWNITETVDSQSTIFALRHGILRFGIPKAVYFDNGHEFTAFDVGGKGNRKRKSDAEKNSPTTILNRLQIEVHNAIVCNAKAKPIERTFRTVKEHFSRATAGFCGGNVLEKPESLKKRIKAGKLPKDFAIREALADWIDGDYNLQPYGGVESQYRTMSRLDVWNQEIESIRKANAADLNLMLMRSTRLQKIKRNGVYVVYGGERIWYRHPEQTILHLDESVYVRYDPADLKSVRLYDEQDRYLYTWSLADTLLVSYLETEQQQIADAQAVAHHSRKFIRSVAKGLTASLTPEQRITMLDMTVRNAQTAKAEQFHIDLPKNIVPIRTEESLEESMAVGAEHQTVDISLKRIQKNSQKRR